MIGGNELLFQTTLYFKFFILDESFYLNEIFFFISVTVNSSMPQSVTDTNYWVNKQMNVCLDTMFWNFIAGGLNEGGTEFGVVPQLSCWCEVLITVSIETKRLWPNTALETIPFPFPLLMFLEQCVTMIENWTYPQYITQL